MEGTVPFPDLVTSVISGRLESVSYIKEDIMSHMHSESYTERAKSCFFPSWCFSGSAWLCFHGNHLVQALIFSHLADCKSFVTRLPSVSSSLKLPGPPLCWQITLPKTPSSLCVPVCCSVYTHALAFRLHCNLASAVPPGHSITHGHVGPPAVPAVRLVSAVKATAVGNRDPIECQLCVLPEPSTTLGSQCAHREGNVSSSPLWPGAYLFLTVPTGSEGCSWLLCGVHFLLLLQVVDSVLQHILSKACRTL